MNEKRSQQIQRERQPRNRQRREWPRRLINSYRAHATCNICSGFATAVLSIWLNREMELFRSSAFMSNFMRSIQTKIPFSTCLIQAADRIPLPFAFTMLLLALLMFSMSLTAWCFAGDIPKVNTPNRLLCLILVCVALGFEIRAGMTMEELLLVALPVDIGIGLVLGSVMAGPARRRQTD